MHHHRISDTSYRALMAKLRRSHNVEVTQSQVDLWGDFVIAFQFQGHAFEIGNVWCEVFLSGDCPWSVFEEMQRELALSKNSPGRWLWALARLGSKLFSRA